MGIAFGRITSARVMPPRVAARERNRARSGTIAIVCVSRILNYRKLNLAALSEPKWAMDKKRYESDRYEHARMTDGPRPTYTYICIRTPCDSAVRWSETRAVTGLSRKSRRQSKPARFPSKTCMFRHKPDESRIHWPKVMTGRMIGARVGA